MYIKKYMDMKAKFVLMKIRPPPPTFVRPLLREKNWIQDVV